MVLDRQLRPGAFPLSVVDGRDPRRPRWRHGSGYSTLGTIFDASAKDPKSWASAGV